MFSKKTTKTFDNKVGALINKVNESDSQSTDEALIVRYDKEELLGAVKVLSDNHKELLKLKEENNTIGEQNMDSKDIMILTGKIKDIFSEEFDKKFDGLKTDLKDIQESVGQTCKDGKCFTNQLDDLNKKLESIDDIKTEVKGFKSNIKEGLDEMNTSISNITDGFNTSLSETNEKLEETCTGIDCINKRFEKEDDMIKCPVCHEIFSLSENTLGDIVICPNCQAKLE